MNQKQLRFGIKVLLLYGLLMQVSLAQMTLDKNWKFCPVNSFQPTVNHHELNCYPINMPSNWEAIIPDYNGYGLLFSEFDLNEEQFAAQMGLYISNLRDSDKTYLNSELIGSTGNFPPDYDKGVLYSRLYQIPLNLLKSQNNEIKIWIFNDGRKGGITDAAPIIDDYVKLIKEQHVRNDVQLMLMVTLIVFGVLHFFHYLFNRKDLENLLFSGFLLAWSLYLYIATESTVYSGWSLSFLFRTNVATFFIIFALYPPFIYLFFKKRIPMGAKLIVAITISMIPLCYLLPHEHWLYYPLQFVELLLIPALVYMFLLMKTAIQEKLPYARLIVMANLSYAILGGHDVVVDFLGIRINNSVLLFGPWALLLLAFSLTLILSHKHMKYYIYASVDQLTQASRYTYFVNDLESMLAWVNQTKQSIVVVMIDLDDFKKINDQYGHNFGNKVIQKVSLAIKKKLHQTDLLTRYGGDEFCLAMSTDDIAYARSKVEAIHHDICHLKLYNDVKVSATFGAVYKGDVEGVLPETLVDEADALLIKTKTGTKGMVTWSQ